MSARENRRRRARARRRMQAWESKPSTWVARLRRKWEKTYPEMRRYRRLLKADYASAELRALASTINPLRQAAKSPRFGDLAWITEVPRDPHLIVAAQLLGISYDEAQKRFAAGDAAVRSKRNYAKHYINFGNPGGLR